MAGLSRVVGAWLWVACPLLVGAAVVTQPVARAEQAWSLVFEGRIIDIDALRTTDGSFLSLDDLVGFLQGLGDVSVQVRADRGLVVIDGRHGPGERTKVQGFTSSSLTLMVNDSQLSSAAELRGGKPYLSAASTRAALQSLGMSVTIDEASGLLAVARPPASKVQPTSSGPAGAPAMDFQQAVMRGSADALRGLSEASVAPVGGSADVCSAMDALRQAWHETEPTREEKAKFQAMAEKFQAARDGQGEVSSFDASDLQSALGSFKGKVEQRAAATQRWQAPSEAQGVKRAGTQFMDNYVDLMKLMYDMSEAMAVGEVLPLDEIDAKVAEVKQLEKVIQSLGPRFDAEVQRVRMTYGCGPATLQSPGS